MEVLDGQQRITSLGRFLTNKFSYHINGRPYSFGSIKDEKLKEKIENTELLVYVCEGSELEIKEWFQIINIAGIELKQQERLNAIYSGPFVTLAKAEFSNSRNSNVQKWSAYISGNVKRQDFLACALDWVSRGNIADYMKVGCVGAGVSGVLTNKNLIADGAWDKITEVARALVANASV